jgi:hypothetical protein
MIPTLYLKPTIRMVKIGTTSPLQKTLSMTGTTAWSSHRLRAEPLQPAVALQQFNYKLEYMKITRNDLLSFSGSKKLNANLNKNKIYENKTFTKDHNRSLIHGSVYQRL